MSKSEDISGKRFGRLVVIPFRPCAKCGGMPNEYGDDHCIQRLGNVMNACCGHGNRMGYIQFDSGHLIEGYFTVKVKQTNGEYL